MAKIRVSVTDIATRHERGFYCLLNNSKAETAYCSGHDQHKQGIVTASKQRPMLRRLSLGLLASAISVASLPAIAQEAGSAEDLGDVMSTSLKDVVNPTFGFQGALQGTYSANQAGRSQESRERTYLSSSCKLHKNIVTRPLNSIQL